MGGSEGTEARPCRTRGLGRHLSCLGMYQMLQPSDRGRHDQNALRAQVESTGRDSGRLPGRELGLEETGRDGKVVALKCEG
jgi:hypothetical protein